MSNVAFRVLEDDAEELSYHFLVGKPELDFPLRTRYWLRRNLRAHLILSLTLQPR
jgi:hypothetical protein